MKSRLDYNLLLTLTAGVALVALLGQWIWMDRKPPDLDELLQNEAYYWSRINERKLNDFKNRIARIQPQYRKIGRTYYEHEMVISKTLDSSRAHFQQAISASSDRDYTVKQVELIERLFDTLFNEYPLLRKRFSPDSIPDGAAYRQEQIQRYQKATDEGIARIRDFKNEMRKQDWAKIPVALRSLALYQREGEYIDFVASDYSTLVDLYFDHYVY